MNRLLLNLQKSFCGDVLSVTIQTCTQELSHKILFLVVSNCGSYFDNIEIINGHHYR